MIEYGDIIRVMEQLLSTLLIQNNNNLDKLRSRLRYSRRILKDTDLDTHQQYGPYADYWEEWVEQAKFISEDLTTDVAATSRFVCELKEFLLDYQEIKRPNAQEKSSLAEMLSLAGEALLWQKDMIKMTDEKISLHRQFTHKLLLVEAIDE